MTNESTRATAAPVTVYVCPERDIECGNRSANWCEKCPQRPYPSTGGEPQEPPKSAGGAGEPATDSAGRVEVLTALVEQMAGAALAAFDSAYCPSSNSFQSARSRFAKARRNLLATIECMQKPEAAREPAPVARDLSDLLTYPSPHGKLVRLADVQCRVFERERGVARELDVEAERREWISVEDRMPPEGEPVLTYGSKRVQGAVMQYTKLDTWQIETASEWHSAYAPTHWMPLPAAPSNSSPVGAKESK